MPRRPRLDLPGFPVHLTQRGVNRGAVFLDDCDRDAYLAYLGKAFGCGGIELHAYVLMSNHVHLLATAPAIGALSRAMCLVGQHYVPEFNRRHARTGTLWEGRFRSCLVDHDSYLLAAYRYIELNPVRAGMADSPDRYCWSSARTNLGLEPNPYVTPHPTFLALGRDDTDRYGAYRRWLDAGIGPDDLERIRAHARQERAYGSERFQSMIAATLNRPVTLRPVGRPRNQPVAGNAGAGFKR